jgi:type VI secretion system Hcp family effector
MPIDAYMVFTPNKSQKQTKEPIEIKGESHDVESQGKGSFEIISFTWGVSAGKEASSYSSAQSKHGTLPMPQMGMVQPGPNLSGAVNETVRRVNVDNFKVSKPFDLASPGLFMACTDPQCVFEQAVVIFRKSGGTEPFVYLKFVFKEVRIDAVDWKIEGSEGGDKPDQEDVKCSFQEVEIFYSPQKATGEKDAKWGSGNTKKSASYKRDSALPDK